MLIVAAVVVGLWSAYRLRRDNPADGAGALPADGADAAAQADDAVADSAHDRALAPVTGDRAAGGRRASAAPPVGDPNPDTPVADTTLPEWPFVPAVMESILISELSRVPGLNVSSDISADCSASFCELRYRTTSRFPSVLGPDSRFRDTLEGPPYNAEVRLSARRLDTEPEEYATSLTLRSHPRPPATPEETARIERRSAEITRSVARTRLPSDAYTAAPVVLGRQNGADQVVENVCSYDCPLDTRQIIYLDVPEGKTCDQLGGTEKRLMARARTGAVLERAFCVPNYLLED